MGPAELVPAESVPIIVKISNIGTCRACPRKTCPRSSIFGAVPKLEELEIKKTIYHRNVSVHALA